MTRARVALALGAGLLLCLVPGLTAANAVPSTRAGLAGQGVSADDLKPSSCSGITLTDVAVGGGGNPSELVLGSPAGESLSGGKGDDCILGGGGDDALRGDQGTDVCIGGPGNDTFHNSCEVQIQ